LIYVRSRRSIVTLGAAGVAWVAVFGALTVAAFAIGGAAVAGFAFAAGAAGGAGVVIWCLVHLVHWPPARLALFRDRLLVIQGRHERGALWVQMVSVTLTDPHSWPNVRVTDRLTIQVKNETPLSFKPARFGLDPAACRDLILQLRDDPKVRSRLPEFDSLRDLAISPVVAGELIEPRL
jgi:hypothetical protein